MLEINAHPQRLDIDVTPFLFPDPASTHAEIQLQDSASTPAAVRIDFTGANRAFGFKTWYASGALAAGTTVEVYDGATMLGDFDLTDGAGDFAGYALDGGTPRRTSCFEP